MTKSISSTVAARSLPATNKRDRGMGQRGRAACCGGFLLPIDGPSGLPCLKLSNRSLPLGPRSHPSPAKPALVHSCSSLALEEPIDRQTDLSSEKKKRQLAYLAARVPVTLDISAQVEGQLISTGDKRRRGKPQFPNLLHTDVHIVCSPLHDELSTVHK